MRGESVLHGIELYANYLDDNVRHDGTAVVFYSGMHPHAMYHVYGLKIDMRHVGRRLSISL